jgi:hypothetical protein
MKPKLSAYVSDSVAQRLELAAKRPGTNKSALVEAALDRFLNPERDANGGAALIRRLDRMSRQLDRSDRDLSIMAETIALASEVEGTVDAIPSSLIFVSRFRRDAFDCDCCQSGGWVE